MVGNMNFGIVSSELLKNSNWKAEALLSVSSKEKGSLKRKKGNWVRLSEFCKERKVLITPKDFPSKDFTYVGLENIESGTGQFVGNLVKKGEEIKSRSKTFKKNDLLYSRLRPNLRKCVVIDDDIDLNACSGEIIVLEIDENVAIPKYIQWFLLKHETTQTFVSSITGSTLPRLSADSLLDSEVNLPSLKEQCRIVKSIEKLEVEYLDAKRKVQELPESILGLV